MIIQFENVQECLDFLELHGSSRSEVKELLTDSFFDEFEDEIDKHSYCVESPRLGNCVIRMNDHVVTLQPSIDWQEYIRLKNNK